MDSSELLPPPKKRERNMRWEYGGIHHMILPLDTTCMKNARPESADHQSLFSVWLSLLSVHEVTKYTFVIYQQLIAVAARSKAWNVFASSHAGIGGSNATLGMDVCLCLFCVCAVLCAGSGLAMGWSPPRSPTDCLRLRNWSENEVFHGCPVLKVGATGIKIHI
jgi:hypothetical protein